MFHRFLHKRSVLFSEHNQNEIKIILVWKGDWFVVHCLDVYLYIRDSRESVTAHHQLNFYLVHLLIMATSPIVLECSVTTKGKCVILLNGYIDILNQDRGKVKYWHCKDRTHVASVRTDGHNHYKVHTGTHNGHPPSPERIEIRKFKTKVKELVIMETTSIARIYEQELATANLSQTALELAPAAKDSRECLSTICLIYLLSKLMLKAISLSSSSRNNARSSHLK